MASTRLAKWGNSLAVRIPKAIAEDVRLREGEPVTVTVASDGGLVIKTRCHKYQLGQLVSRITARNRHAEVDWGKPRGGEIW